MKGKTRFITVCLLFSLLVGFLFISAFVTIIEEKENGITIDNTYYTSNFPLSQESSKKEETNLKVNSEKENTSPSPLFTVKEYKGVIGIYNFGENTPFKTENLFVNNLPEKDREIIKNGRDFFSYKEMVEFLMDYE